MIGIYGANGFIGRHAIDRLSQGPRRIRAVSRRFDSDPIAAHRGRVDFVQAELSDRFKMLASLEDIDTVVQMMSSSSPGLQNNYITADIIENVVPHVEFLQSCSVAGVRRFIFLSSGGTVYGQPKTLPISEDHPTRPINSHGVTKLTVEHYAQLFAATCPLEVVILRLANPYGPGQVFRKGQGLIPAILDRHRTGRPVRIFGDGSARRDYIHIDDVIDALERVIATPHLPEQVFNIGSGEGCSVIQIVQEIEAVLGERIAREFAPTRNADVEANILDISRARRVLDWTPRIGLKEGIARTLGVARA